MFETGPHLDASTFKSLDPTMVQILDVRERWEYERAHLPGAQLIPLGELVDRVGELDAARPVATYCHHGMRSLQVADWLREQGVANCQSLSGGIDLWSCQIDPSVPRY